MTDNIDDLLGRLNPKTAAMFRRASEVKNEVLPTPSLGLNRAIGGVGYGRQTMIWGNRSGGKAQPVTTEIPTPSGSKKMGDLSVGDYVISGATGEAVAVTGVFAQGVLDTYEVTFSDGTKTLCNDEHIWTVQTHKQKYGVGRGGKRLNDNFRDMTLREIIDAGLYRNASVGQSGDANYKWYLPPQPVVEYSDDTELIIEPYLLGVLLGDGYLGGTTVTYASNDPEIMARINARSDLEAKENKGFAVGRYAVNKCIGRIRDLGLHGTTSHTKFIPEHYLSSRVDDRYELLRGLMDTDGSQEASSPNKARFFTSSNMLAKQVQGLVRSLGGTARLRSYARPERNVEYIVTFYTPRNPFGLSRKADLYKGSTPAFKAIAGVEKVGKDEMVCISVDSADGLYLTNDFIVTHNTLFCLGLAANAQAEGRTVAWIDAERNYDPEWSGRHGVDSDKVLWSPVTSIADMADAGHDFIKAGVDLLVVDSISTLLPQSYFVDGEMKALADTGQIGTFSKNMGQAVNMFNRVNENTAVVLISQVRNQIGSYGASLTPMGGKAVEHMNSLQIKLWSNPSDKEAIQGKVAQGDLILQKPIGRPVTWTVEKNRGPGMNESSKYDMYFKGDFVGVDRIGEVVDFGVEAGLIKKGGSWYTIGEERLQGRHKAVSYLRDNPELEEKIYGEIIAQSI